ncbi:hypothetical protein BV898_15026 [Hypsibius exemplaris]|uniref:GH18 domain-containing protein n=1 Tax=Hypsibius exemplaris TaxID=2072580 RepID=A0A9X6ND94_HYPEX|nr:hypothetical protein BV898_15026 [Hypsibius exemplaris]
MPSLAIKNEDATNHFDEEIAASYAYTPFWWIGYNDIATVRTKTKWAVQNGYGGVYATDVSEDDAGNDCQDGAFPLLSAMKKSVDH